MRDCEEVREGIQGLWGGLVRGGGTVGRLGKGWWDCGEVNKVVEDLL